MTESLPSAIIQERAVRDFDRVWSDVNPTVRNVLAQYGVGVTASDREDLMQQTRIRLWDAREDIDTARSPRSYAARTARNLILDHDRRRRRRPVEVDGHIVSDIGSDLSLLESLPSDQPSALALVMGEEGNTHQIRAAAQRLGRMQKTVLVARLDNQTFAEISDETGMPVGQVRSTLFRAIRNLKRYFQEAA